MKHDIGAIANCLFCDSYVVVVVDRLAYGQAGKLGQEKRLEKLMEVQSYLSEHLFTYHHCPTCTELLYNQRFLEWLDRDDRPECSISVMRWVDFEGVIEDLPMYVNEAPPESKPRWVLRQGVGPAHLEIDNSHSGRIHKPTLAQYGIANCKLITREERMQGRTSEELKLIMDTVLLVAFVNEDPRKLLGQLFERYRPLFVSWLTNPELAAAFQAAAAERDTAVKIPFEPAGPETTDMEVVSTLQGAAVRKSGCCNCSLSAADQRAAQRRHEKFEKRKALRDDIKDQLRAMK
eukprot:TRINITY_DN24766_c0_g1_i1.p2 TRINITY_DN24766_c0_g1~~TRINITY_DN24766_c0_g1_i1.p2  ORF type:complete len:291 (+),score=51.46 TRINITY_DN24766_c0_g1_i1:1393-2265(+)